MIESSLSFFKRFYLFIFRERGREEEREGMKHQCLVASCLPRCPAPGDLARNPGMWPDWESNQHPLGSQASAQCTEPHQPGQNLLYLYIPNTWQVACVIGKCWRTNEWKEQMVTPRFGATLYQSVLAGSPNSLFWLHVWVAWETSKCPIMPRPRPDLYPQHCSRCWGYSVEQKQTNFCSFPADTLIKGGCKYITNCKIWQMVLLGVKKNEVV